MLFSSAQNITPLTMLLLAIRTGAMKYVIRLNMRFLPLKLRILLLGSSLNKKQRLNPVYSSDIQTNIAKAAAQCGLADFWELHFWNEDYQLNPNILYQSLFEFISIAHTKEDLQALWLFNCGIHTWYTQEYYRQPILFRWLCNSEWLKETLCKHNLHLRYVSRLESIP